MSGACDGFRYPRPALLRTLRALSSEPLRRFWNSIARSPRRVDPCLDGGLKFLKGLRPAFAKRRATREIGGDRDPASVFIAPEHFGGVVQGHESFSFSYLSIIMINCRAW